MQPWTWKWNQCVPTDGKLHTIQREMRWKPQMSAKEQCKAHKAACQLKKKQSNKANEWESNLTLEDMFDTYKTTFLHEPDLMYGYWFGVDLDKFVEQIDPLKQFRIMKELSTMGVIQPQFEYESGNVDHVQKKAYIAAAQLSNSLPVGMDPTLSVEELAELKLSSKDMAKLTCKCSVYFSNREDGIPIVIDTGASMLVTPCKQDFVGKIRPTKIGDLVGLSGSAHVAGIGTIQWTV
jgi:hypothetical protein